MPMWNEGTTIRAHRVIRALVENFLRFMPNNDNWQCKFVGNEYWKQHSLNVAWFQWISAILCRCVFVISFRVVFAPPSYSTLSVWKVLFNLGRFRTEFVGSIKMHGIPFAISPQHLMSRHFQLLHMFYRLPTLYSAACVLVDIRHEVFSARYGEQWHTSRFIYFSLLKFAPLPFFVGSPSFVLRLIPVNGLTWLLLYIYFQTVFHSPRLLFTRSRNQLSEFSWIQIQFQ